MKLILATVLLFLGVAGAQADTCWWHNGSLMRLKAVGDDRYFYYEAPRPGLSGTGVRPGTLLFNGKKNGNWYSGLSRVFSSACPGNPLEYYVEGPVAPNQTKVTMQGTRETSENCRPTGNVVVDSLIFTYAHQC